MSGSIGTIAVREPVTDENQRPDNTCCCGRPGCSHMMLSAAQRAEPCILLDHVCECVCVCVCVCLCAYVCYCFIWALMPEIKALID